MVSFLICTQTGVTYVDVPLLEYTFLCRWIAASKVVETLYMWLRAVRSEREAR
jgi:hypothetical protein